MDLRQWLGNDSDMSVKIWTDKYQFENESFDDWVERIANNNEDLKRLILEKRFLFGGRIL